MTRSTDILIVDDEAGIRDIISGILEDEGYRPRQADDARSAYAAVRERVPDLVILDIWLEGSEQDGLQILESIRQAQPDLPFLMISGHGTIETAVSAIKRGAYDFIEKPFEADRLLLTIDRALENARLRRENRDLKALTESSADLIGTSPAIAALRQTLERVAHTNSRLLITGEPGSGKDVAARQIHRLSGRSAGPFKVANCAVLRPDRFEAELFGTEQPGEQPTAGILEQANGGVLLLDEVADMPMETQGKIVRALQEQRFVRIGGQTPIDVDVRVLASTNRNLQQMMQEGRFRQDLFYRLNVVPIAIPPLRERSEDIPELAQHFIRQYSAQSGLPPCNLSQQAVFALQHYAWPGNVRQLRNTMEWIMIMWGDAAIGIDQLPPEIAGMPMNSEQAGGESRNALLTLPLREARELFERDYLIAQMRRFGGNISRTAEFIGMERSALHRKLKQLNVVGARVSDEDIAGEADRRSA